MDNIKKHFLCTTHSLECIAIDTNSESDTLCRYLCPKCLTAQIKKKDIYLINEADNQFQEIKKTFTERRNQQGIKNIEILQNLKSNVLQLQNQYDQLLNKIKDNIDQQITILEEQQKIFCNKLLQLDIDSYLTSKNELNQHETNLDQLQNIIQDQFGKLVNIELIDQCRSILKSLDNQEIQFVPEKKIIEKKKIKQKKNPSLPITCQSHQKEIILFDLNEQRARENRIACSLCVNGKQGPFNDLIYVQQQWLDYENQKKQLIITQQELIQKKQGQVSEQFSTLLQQFTNQISKGIGMLSEKCCSYLLFNENEMQTIQKEWFSMSKEEILQITDILSQPKNKDQLTSQWMNVFNQQEREINSIIMELLLNLQDFEQSIYSQINPQLSVCKLIKSNQNAETQTIQISSISVEQQTNYEYKFKDQLFSISRNKKQQKLNDASIQLQATLQMTISCINQGYVFKPNFQLIQSNFMTQNDHCYVIGYYNEQKIMLAGAHGKIKVFELNHGELKEIQLLADHSTDVVSFYFMKITTQFVSAGWDSTIRIWKLNDDRQWICQQVLQHQEKVCQVIMNSAEDLIISCGYPNTIKFWTKNTQWDLFQTLTIHTSCVWSICLNESQNQLLSCGNDSQIHISQVNSNKQLNVIQTISGQNGYRICFITDNLFAFQSIYGQYMDIYELNNQNKQFIRTQQVQVEQDGVRCERFFTMKYYKTKGIIVSKNGNRVNIIRRKNNNEFIVEQSIKLTHYFSYGDMTQDCQYLMIWDYSSKQFQIRKQQ